MPEGDILVHREFNRRNVITVDESGVLRKESWEGWEIPSPNKINTALFELAATMEKEPLSKGSAARVPAESLVILADARAPYTAIEPLLQVCAHSLIGISRVDLVVRTSEHSGNLALPIELQRDLGTHLHDPGGPLQSSVTLAPASGEYTLEFWATHRTKTEGSTTPLEVRITRIEELADAISLTNRIPLSGYTYISSTGDLKWGDVVLAIQSLLRERETRILAIPRPH